MIKGSFRFKLLISFILAGVLIGIVGLILQYFSIISNNLLLIIAYIIIIFGCLIIATERIIIGFKGKISYKKLCLTSMFSAIGFYLLTPFSILLFKNSISYFFLFPAFISIISALISIFSGTMFLKKRN
jgi:hypothetical protein